MSTLTELGLAPPPKGQAAQLVYDLETWPSEVYTWGAYDQTILGTGRFDWGVLMFSYKWLNQGKRPHKVAIWDAPKYKPGRDHLDDAWVVERIHALFDAADVTIAHNNDRFDRRKSNARFLLQGHMPPSPYQTVDTLKVSRREFAHYKHTLDDLGRMLLDDQKQTHDGMRLWFDCMDGIKKRQKEMERYANHDVVLLEKVYRKLLPWMGMPGKPAAPNMGHWSKGDLVCPKCGNGNVVINRWDKLHRTSVSEFPTVHCQQANATVAHPCGGYSRLRNRVTQTRGKGVQAL